MKRDEMIQHADVFLDASDQDDQQLVATLLKRGVPLEAAERLVAFLPIAFGRVILETIAPVKLSDFFLINETGQQYLLNGERIFNDAQELARDSYRSGHLPRNVFSAIALRSAELMAANKALNSGAVRALVPSFSGGTGPLVRKAYLEGYSRDSDGCLGRQKFAVAGNEICAAFCCKNGRGQSTA